VTLATRTRRTFDRRTLNSQRKEVSYAEIEVEGPSRAMSDQCTLLHAQKNA
jgi:hypothetical protein